MKLLWVSNRLFDDREETQSGVWLKALAVKLADSNEIFLGNVSVKKGLKETEPCDFRQIKQWALPLPKINRKGIPDNLTCKRFEKIVNEFNPDIIQIWGSENPLKILPFENNYQGAKVLTMQGVLGSIGPVLLNGMNIKELISTIGIREILLRRNLFTEKRSFDRSAEIENKMIKKSKYIITQSEWTEAQILNINPCVKIFRVHRALRDQFIKCKKWFEFNHSKPVLYSASIGYSLKGLHIFIKALGIVKNTFPDVEVRLAGLTGRRDFLGDGYLRYILRLIKKFDLEKNIIWLGAITADEIVKNLQEASVFINPSFVESYSLTLAEAMSVGTPSVVTFAGAMPELAENNKEALFFTPGDYKRCAYLITKLLKDKELALKISKNAVKRAEERNLKTDIVNQHINIYKDILRDSGRI